MATIANTANNNAFISYGDVNFGRDSYQPEYSLRGQFVYDDANRSVIGTKYTLIVKATFAGSSEAECATKLAAVQRVLSKARRTLVIKGLGLNADIDLTTDQDNGPKPLFFEWQPWGTLAWECVWGIEFTIRNCTSQDNRLGWAAFNFDTTWQNDFEGLTTRTIAGHIEIRDSITDNADRVRENLNIVAPSGFKRINNIWHESADKKRLDFVVVDQQLEGDPYPAGVTLADGYCDFDSIGPGFAQANVSMGMVLKTAPETNRGLAGIIAIQAMLGKQSRMQQRLRTSGGTVIPTRFHLRNQKFDGARVTEFSCSWTLTKCFNDMLNATGIWEPLVDSNYTQWRASMNALWGNRGTARLQSMPTDDVIIDACSSVSAAVIGNTPVKSEDPNLAGSFKLTCPEIPDDGGWISYDVKVRLLRKDKQTEHRQAATYATAPVTATSTAQSNMLATGDPGYTQSASEESVVENHGYPEQIVLLQFKGMRFKHDPVVPHIKSIGGRPVTFIESSYDTPRVVFDIFGCPVKYISKWVKYRVSGHVETLKTQGDPTKCSNPVFNPEA